ncbi:MAG TPA: TRAP transporter substrate-binding protein DctP, partial [Gaiellales bacterium]
MKPALPRPTVLTAILACIGLCALTACAGGSAGANKAGAKVDRQVTLRLEMPDAGEPRGLFFAQAVARRSGGSVRVRIDVGRYSSGHAGSELALARALEGGHEEIAYVASRAWASGGLPAFQALLAPFLITTGAAGQRVATGPIARRVLASLPHSVVGLALVPDEPRRVLARYPPSSLAAFSGTRIQTVGNPRAAAAFAALGAVPAKGLITSGQIRQAIFSGSLDAVESSPSSILANAYSTRATYLSAYAVFPKFASIVVARATWQRLSPAQRTAVRAAAADTVAAAGRELPAQQRTELAQLCRAHVKITRATRAALATLQEASEPSLAGLVADPASAGVLTALYRLPGAGAQPLATPLPAACRAGGAAAPAVRALLGALRNVARPHVKIAA